MTPTPRAQGRKVVGESALLGRSFHADVFVVGEAPRVLVLLFGGSGVTKSAYDERGESITPLFGAAFDAAKSAGDFGFAYVTAPYDVPFAHFQDDHESAELWDAHVRTELLPTIEAQVPALRGIPRYLAGYSGGALLALSGHHLDRESIGACALGADGLHRDLQRSRTWGEPISLAYNRDDDVRRLNRDTIVALTHAGIIEERPPRRGGHALQSYVENGTIEDLIRDAVRASSDEEAPPSVAGAHAARGGYRAQPRRAPRAR